MKNAKILLLFIVVLISINSMTIPSMSRISLFDSYGDSYADEYLEESSSNCVNGNNAENAPDNIYAEIFYDYSNGILTLDMGLNEEILDGGGDDFFVIAGEGEYYVKVENSLSKPFTLVGLGAGNQSFDLNSIGFSSARYIQIEYRSGDKVEIDAIEAIYYNIIESDEEKPVIIEIADFSIFENQSQINLLWEVNDLTPWNFSIYVNNTIIESGPWDGSNIDFDYLALDLKLINVKLVLWDYFENFAESDVVITIKNIELPTSDTSYVNILLIISFISIVAIFRRTQR